MLSNLIEKSAKFALEKPAPFLRYTTAIIYMISTAAQSGGIIINKDLPKKEKNFLLLQEVINGVLELGTFMTIATGFEKFGRTLVDKGKIVGAEVAKNNPTFKKGVAMLFSIAGTIVAFNLVTPLLRNPIIHMIQKIAGKGKTDPKNVELTRPILPNIKLNPTVKFNSHNPFANFQQSLHTNKLPSRITTFTSTGMRI